MLPVIDENHSISTPDVTTTPSMPQYDNFSSTLYHNDAYYGNEVHEWTSSSYNYTDPVSNITIRMSMQPVGYFQQVISTSVNGEEIAVSDYISINQIYYTEITL